MKKIERIAQHFTKEEEGFVEKVMEWCQQVEDTYSYHLTSFLNPRQDSIVGMIAGHFQLKTYSSRDILKTEYSRVLIAPDYYQLDVHDFDILGLEINYPRKFMELSHSQVLGTLLHQLGIRRDCLGDILVTENQLVVCLDQKFEDLVMSSITKIAKVPVSLTRVDWSQLQVEGEARGVTKDMLVSSNRLDKLVAAVFQLSRSAAVKLIESGQVKLDYVQTEEVSRKVELGQLISVRRYGRVRLKEILGYSKQGKLKLQIDITRK